MPEIPSQRPGQELHQHFKRDRQRSHLPHDERGKDSHHPHGRFLPSMFLPPAQIDGNPRPHRHPGTDNEQNQSDVKQWVSHQRRIKRVEHGRFAQEDHRRRHHGARQHQKQRNCRPGDGNMRFQLLADHRISEGHGKKRGQDNGVDDSVSGQAFVVIDAGEGIGSYHACKVQDL